MNTMGRNAEPREHILVCVSPSPSNPKVIMAAVRMAEAFHASLTALYVRPTGYDGLSEENKARLQNNIRLAEQHGAAVITVTGDDVPQAIGEYARVSDTTMIVIGRSGAERRHIWSRMTLTERITLSAPDLDVYIIPDSSADIRQQKEKIRISGQMRPTWKDSLITVLLLAAAVGIGMVFTRFGFSEANIITVFILGVLVISLATVSPLYSAAGSLAGVLLFNWFFTEPLFSFHTYEAEYAVTFGIMLVSSLITGTLANKMKQNAGQAAREAFRTKVLLDTSQLLQKAKKADEVIRITARQIITLLDRNAVFYPCRPDGSCGPGEVFGTVNGASAADVPEEREEEIVRWAADHRQAAGFQLENYGSAGSRFHPIALNSHCYGVMAVRLSGTAPEAFENSVFQSVLGECALALENLRNAEEKEQASVMARNEQLRANLLRSISHDIRTPLTSISGNASNLLSHYRQLDDETLEHIFSDIYDDSEWLTGLVENLLSISRIENGRMELHLSPDIMNDVIEEALKHIDRKADQHRITVSTSDELLLVNMDAGLMVQVLINLINNAVKYTPEGSEITIRSGRTDNAVTVSVCDNGPGIPDECKPHIFELFYTGQNKIADGRRGLGLGLALCRSIVEAHGGTITLTDSEPAGCCFTVSLPVEEVQIDE